MKLVIYGAGNCGKYIYEQIAGQANSHISVRGFIDNMKKEAYGGLPVWTLESFLKSDISDMDGIIIAAAGIRLKQLFLNGLLEHDISLPIYIVEEILYTAKLNVLCEDGSLSSYIKPYQQMKPTLPYLEYHVVDNCNLNCRGCAHLDNLYTAHPCDKRMFETELKKLGEKFDNISVFRLMGGEPLLCDELPWFVKEVREKFPLSDIRIVTNGLLLPKISEELISTVQTCAVQFDITQYPPTRKLLPQIIGFLNRKHLRYDVTKEVGEFWHKFYCKGNADIKKAFFDYCSAGQGSIGGLKAGTCVFLRKGRLYACAPMAMLYEKQDFFQFHISQEERNESSVDIINGAETGWEILAKLNRPASLCRFCGKPAPTEWKTGGEPQLADWLVDIG